MHSRSFAGSAEMRLLAFSPDGKMLASAEGHIGGRVRLWNVARGEEISSYPGHRGAVQSLSCTADGRTLFSAGSDGTIRAWDVVAGRQRGVFEDRKADFQSVAAAADGKTIAAIDAAGEVTFRTDTAKVLERSSLSSSKFAFAAGAVPKPLLAFSEDGRLAVAGRKAWEVGLAKAPRTLRTDKDEGFPIALSPDGAHFASMTAPLGGMGGGDKLLIHSRRLQTGEEVFRIKGTIDDAFWAVAFSADGKILALSRSKRDKFHGNVYFQHQLVFWEVASGKPFLKIDMKSVALTLAFSPDGKLLAMALGHGGMYDSRSMRDRSIRIWDVTTGKLLEELPGHGSWVNALLFSPDGRWLFSGGVDGSILVWDTHWPHPRPQRMGNDLTPEQLRAAWADLAGADAAKAFRSLSNLAAVPRRAAPFLSEQLPRPPAPERQLIARLICRPRQRRFRRPREGKDGIGEAG